MGKPTTIEGIVSKKNDNGIKIQGHETWLNYSRPEYRKEPWHEDFEVGDYVKMQAAESNNKWYVSTIEIKTRKAKNGANQDTKVFRDSDTNESIWLQVLVKAAVELRMKYGTTPEYMEAVSDVTAAVSQWRQLKEQASDVTEEWE